MFSEAFEVEGVLVVAKACEMGASRGSCPSGPAASTGTGTPSSGSSAKNPAFMRM
jgi:hypothetical protein